MNSVFELDNGLTIDPIAKPRLQPQQSARNGMVVSAKLQSDMASLVNQLARHRTKCYARFGGDITAPADDKVWRFSGHVGPMASTVVARVLMAPATQAIATSNPRIQLALYDSNGVNFATQSAYFGSSYGRTPNEDPSEWAVATIVIDVRNYRDTAFRAQLHAADEARPVSGIVYESSMAPDVANGYCRQVYSVGESITDEDRSSIQTLARSLYKRGGSALFNASSDIDASPYTAVSATYAGLWDGFGGGGFRLNQEFCNRKTATTVPVKFELCAGLSGGSGDIRVVDSSGNVYATWSLNAAGGAFVSTWQTAQTANLPADERMYTIEMRCDGVNTIKLYALNCFRYSA